MKRRIVAWCVLVCMAGSVVAEVTPDQVAEFLESNEYWAKPMYDERSELYLALKGAPVTAPIGPAAETLAAKWRIPVAIATSLIEATVIAEHRYFGESTEDREDRLQHAAHLFREAVAAVPQSPESWALGIRFWADYGGCGDQQLRNNYLQQSFAEREYFELDECENWLPYFLTLYPDNLAARLRLADYLEGRDPAASLAASRWVLDAFDTRADTPPNDVELMATRYYWLRLGKLGLFPALLAEGARLPESQLDALLHRPWKGGLLVDGHEIFGAYHAEAYPAGSRLEWMAALIAANRLDEARSELAHLPRLEGYVADALADKYDGDVYARYVGDGEKGLLWGIDGDTGMRVAARFLAANRMESAAEMLRMNACNRYFDRDGWQEIDKDLARLPAAFQAHLAQHTEWYAQARREAGCNSEAKDRVEMSSRLTRYAEVPLSDTEKAAAPLANYTDEIPLPESFELVRAERAGKNILAVCISPAVDPGGEVSRGGYWLLRSHDGGASWMPPAYLGFQDQSPYVVSSEARVSMFAEGALRLEAEVAELDPESITFPPVALALRREAKDLYIEIPYDALDRDTDGDGLTDLLEAKLATDPAKADTDGDGLTDQFDDFPQASARSEPNALAPIIVDLLRRVVGFERAGIIEPVRRGESAANPSMTIGRWRAGAGSVLFRFVSGDARQFEGLRAEGQVIVLDARQEAEIRARFGPFFPLEFPTILIDPAGQRALVRWSAGWTGGTLIYRLRNGKWIGKEGSRWITREIPRIISAPSTSPG